MNAEQEEAKRNAFEQRLATTELGFSIVVGDELQLRGEYSSDRFAARYPKLHHVAAELLKEGISPKKISKIMVVDIRTINALAVKLEAEGAVTPYKERTVAKLKSIVTLIADDLIDKAKDGKLGTIDLGILIEKIELLDGRATSRQEVITATADDDYTRAVRAARALPAVKVYDAEEIPAKGPTPLLTSEAADRATAEAFIVPKKDKQTVENEQSNEN